MRPPTPMSIPVRDSSLVMCWHIVNDALKLRSVQMRQMDCGTYRYLCGEGDYTHGRTARAPLTRRPESWDQKEKFPQALKPMLSQLAVLAIQLDEHDEHFFNLMSTLFPYNRYTMTVRAFLFPHLRMMKRADSSPNRNSSDALSSMTTLRSSWHGKTRCF